MRPAPQFGGEGVFVSQLLLRVNRGPSGLPQTRMRHEAVQLFGKVPVRSTQHMEKKRRPHVSSYAGRCFWIQFQAGPEAVNKCSSEFEDSILLSTSYDSMQPCSLRFNREHTAACRPARSSTSVSAQGSCHSPSEWPVMALANC